MTVVKEHTVAIRIIELAAASANVVVRQPDTTVQGNASPMELHWATGGRVGELTLVSWPAHHPFADLPPVERKDPMWVLRRSPTRLLNELRNANQNFVDVDRGVVRIVLPGLFIDRTDLAPDPRTPNASRQANPFADRASLVARTLFRDPNRRWGTRELAQAAGVSPMVASTVTRRLAEWGVIDIAKAGQVTQIQLRSERRLIEVWTTYYEWQKNPRLAFAAPVGDSSKFLHRAGAAFRRHRWALTMQAGAGLVAPHAAWDKLHIYVDVHDPRDLNAIAHAAGWPQDPAGRVVLMQPWYNDAIWTEIQTVRDLPVVSTLQLVLDLWNYPVRGREQAEHLLEIHKMERKRRAVAESPNR